MNQHKKASAVLLKDRPSVRWIILILLSLATLSQFVFGDILSPVKSLLETTRGWNSATYGAYAGSIAFINVFFFFLIFAGVILDKMGTRFTVVLSGVVVLAGATINWYSLTDMFTGSGLEIWFINHLNYIPVFHELGVSPFYTGMPASAKLASIGFMIFGCGVEMSGIAITRGIIKWFKGKEMALAMGLNMGIGRLGLATCMIFSPIFAKNSVTGAPDVSGSAAFGVILLLASLVMFVVFSLLDKRADSQNKTAEEKKDDPFKISDVGIIFRNSSFWLIALLCVLYYSAIIPFQKFAVNILECNLSFTSLSEDSFWATGSAVTMQYLMMIATAAMAFSSNFCKKKVRSFLLVCAVVFLAVICYVTYQQQSAGAIFSVFPLLAVCVTPILGNFIDRNGKATTLLILGSILLMVCHLTFAFILPQMKGSEVGGFLLAYVSILVLGASFSLVPVSLWSSVPKIIDKKVIGTAYAMIFWIQNIGLWLIPILIGKSLISSNTDITEMLGLGLITSDEASVMYDYTNPLILLACLGAASLLLGFILKKQRQE